jgi:chemotaxis protein MotB
MKLIWSVMCVGLTLFSCVSQKKYDALNRDKDSTVISLNTKIDDCGNMNTSLKGEIANLQDQQDRQKLVISKLQDSIQICQNELEESQTYIKTLGETHDDQKMKVAAEIDKKNKAIQTKELELNKALASAEAERLRLENARKELEKVSGRVKVLEAELRRKDSAVILLKDAIIKALAGFEKLDVKVEYRNGKVYVILPEKLLFKSGSTSVDPKGQEALIELAKALNKKADVQVAVEGHTDNVPMNGESIKDNWDLSVLRATSIAKIMINEGKLSAKRISANGRGETIPVATNDTPEGRAKNRRTEIILTPQLDKILEILNNN